MTLKPGIYFGLAEEKYFSDPALSRSDIVHLLDTPNTYWKNSFMNPERKAKKSSDAMDYGSAFDCMLFEPLKFSIRYQVVPIDEWAEHKQKIKYDDYFAMIESIKVLRAGKDSTLFLSGGYPQVTIVFDDAGLRFRARIDYFTPVLSVDFKTARNLHAGHLKRAFDEYGYDIQYRLYKRARERFKEQYDAGEADVYGRVDRGWFAKFMASPINEFIFIFQRSSSPYPFLPLMPEDDTEESGMRKIERAQAIYTKYCNTFGTKEWPVCEGKVKPFSMFYGIRDEH